MDCCQHRSVLKKAFAVTTSFRRCGQTNFNKSPIGGVVALDVVVQAMRDCYPASAAERRSF